MEEHKNQVDTITNTCFTREKRINNNMFYIEYKPTITNLARKRLRECQLGGQNVRTGLKSQPGPERQYQLWSETRGDTD